MLPSSVAPLETVSGGELSCHCSRNEFHRSAPLTPCDAKTVKYDSSPNSVMATPTSPYE